MATEATKNKQAAKRQAEMAVRKADAKTKGVFFHDEGWQGIREWLSELEKYVPGVSSDVLFAAGGGGYSQHPSRGDAKEQKEWTITMPIGESKWAVRLVASQEGERGGYQVWTASGVWELKEEAVSAAVDAVLEGIDPLAVARSWKRPAAEARRTLQEDSLGGLLADVVPFMDVRQAKYRAEYDDPERARVAAHQLNLAVTRDAMERPVNWVVSIDPMSGLWFVCPSDPAVEFSIPQELQITQIATVGMMVMDSATTTSADIANVPSVFKGSMVLELDFIYDDNQIDQQGMKAIEKAAKILGCTVVSYEGKLVLKCPNAEAMNSINSEYNKIKSEW